MIRKDPNKPIKIFRCLYRRCLPLPIPNRAVKPARADGIAVTGGRVGRCLFLHGSPCWKQSRASCVYILPYFHVQAIAYPPPIGYHSTWPSVSPVHR